MTLPLRSAAAARLIALHEQNNPRWKVFVRNALELKGNIPDAAKALCISERALRNWLRKDPAVKDGIILRSVGWQKGRSRPSRKTHTQNQAIAVETKNSSVDPETNEKKTPCRYAVVAQEWECPEGDLYVRPDGVSLHMTTAECHAYCAQVVQDQNENGPRPRGEPYLLQVDRATYGRVLESEHGIRLSRKKSNDLKRLFG